uniref:GST N-terminal domain-containing protein n=1 Tax=Capra hircus TaxID=9925 RepID=A0A8C2NT47_CAPHI
MAEAGKLQLFVKASEDGESVGHCPSCQRLFMVLLLKGVPFTLTTVDTRRSPEVLKDFAPGSQLPILLCDGDAKTDTLQIEEFLEETLGPPEFPSLAPRYRESAAAGNDVFHTFSAFIKNPVPAQDDALHQQLLRALAKLDSYLRAPLEHELGQQPTGTGREAGGWGAAHLPTAPGWRDWTGLPNQSGQGGAAGWLGRVGSEAPYGQLRARGRAPHSSALPKCRQATPHLPGHPVGSAPLRRVPQQQEQGF